MKAALPVEILAKILHPFGIDWSRAKLVQSYSNWIYDCGDKFLRVTDLSHTSLENIEAELAWISFLENHKVKVLKVLPSIYGNSFELISIENQQRQFLVLCTKTIKGRKLSKKDWNSQHFEKLGKLTGRLHLLSKVYKIPEGIQYLPWQELHKVKNFQNFPLDEERLDLLYENLLKKINSFPINPNNYGIIHFDIHFQNYLIDEEEDLVLMDFELTCKNWYAYDIASVYYYAYQITGNKEWLEKEFWIAFWKGYQEFHQLSPREKSWLPYFILLRDFFLLGFLHTLWNTQNLKTGQQNLIHKIRTNIRQRRQSLGL